MVTALRNLLDNAIRYSPPGGTVSLLDRSDSERARIAVVDEGSGFPESFVAQAFERFSQADDARSRPGGAGLGLAIARTLIEAHDGSIVIIPGQGGQVEIDLPFEPGKRPIVTQRRGADRPKDPNPRNLTPRREGVGASSRRRPR